MLDQDSRLPGADAYAACSALKLWQLRGSRTVQGWRRLVRELMGRATFVRNRFTNLPKSPPAAASSAQALRQRAQQQQQQFARSQRLTRQMENRPAVAAALRIKQVRTAHFRPPSLIS